MPKMDFKDKIQKLTSQQIQELQMDEAMRVIENNVNNLADIENVLFDSIAELGKFKVKVEQLKSLKNMILEQNRALKSVISNG